LSGLLNGTKGPYRIAVVLRTFADPIPPKTVGKAGGSKLGGLLTSALK
jgi:hypothetical protein